VTSADLPRARNVEELLEWFEDVAASSTSQTVSITDADATSRLDVVRGFYEGLVEHPLYGGGWPQPLPPGAIAPHSNETSGCESRRMVWLGVRASAEPIAEAVQLAAQLDQLDRIDQLDQLDQLDRIGPSSGRDPLNSNATLGEFRGALACRDIHDAGNPVEQAFALLGCSTEGRASDVAAAARVVHAALSGIPLLADGGVLGLDGPSLRSRAVMAAAWLQRISGELPIALIIDGADDAGPFVVELVHQLHDTSVPVLIVLAGAPERSASPVDGSLAGPFHALRAAPVPARVLPPGEAGVVGALLTTVASGGVFTRAHVAACRAAVAATLSADTLLEALGATGWLCQLTDDVFSFSSAEAWHAAREQAAGLAPLAAIDVARIAAARQIARGRGDGGLALLLHAPLRSSWARASTLARWGELGRAVTSAPSSAPTATPWQQFVGVAWSRLASDGSDDLAPLTVSAAGESDAATSSILAGLLLAPRDSRRAAALIRAGVAGLGAAEDNPHDDGHRARVAAARGLLMLGDLDGVDEALAGLLRWLPAAARDQLEQLSEWRAVPGVVARSAATLENLHAIAIVRISVPRTPALGHVLLARLELLERFGRLGIAADAASVAAEAIDAFRGTGPASRDQLWRARRWAAWVALRCGDPSTAAADLHALLHEVTEVVGALDPRSVSTSEWLARCELEAGRLDDALPRLQSVVAARLLHAAPADAELLSAQHWLGVCLARSGRHADAVALLGDVVSARTATLSADHEDLLASRQAFGSAMVNTGRVDEGLTELDDVVARRLLLDVPDAPRVVAARHSRATCLLFAGRNTEALVELEDLVAIRTEQLEPNDPLLLHVRNDRAVCLLFLGRWDEALADLDDIVPRHERALGEGHLIVVLARHQRATCLRALGRHEEALGELNALLGWTESWTDDNSIRETLRRERAELVS